MNKQNPTLSPNTNNAQDGNAVLLSTNTGHAVREILHEVENDWQEVGNDLTAKGEFLASEFSAFGRSILRCGFLVHEIDDKKLYEKFGSKSTADFLGKAFDLKPPAVSRFRTSYAYALPISEALPEAKLNEAQMRELHTVVGKLNPELKGEKKVEKAVELFKGIYNENPAPTAIDIAKLCPETKRKTKASSAGSLESKDGVAFTGYVSEDKQQDVEKMTVPAGNSLGEDLADDELNSAYEKYGKVTVEDQIGSRLASELSELLAHVLSNQLIDEKIQERFETAFEELGIEPALVADEGSDYQ